jgi:hypothetical protein
MNTLEMSIECIANINDDPRIMRRFGAQATLTRQCALMHEMLRETDGASVSQTAQAGERTKSASDQPELTAAIIRK